MKKIMRLFVVIALLITITASETTVGAKTKYTNEEIQLAKIVANAQKKVSEMRASYVSCVIKGNFSKTTSDIKELSKKDQKNVKALMKKIKYFIVLDDDTNDIAVTSDFKLVTYKKMTYSLMWYVNVSTGKYLSKQKTKNIDTLRKKYLDR